MEEKETEAKNRIVVPLFSLRLALHNGRRHQTACNGRRGRDMKTFKLIHRLTLLTRVDPIHCTN